MAVVNDNERITTIPTSKCMLLQLVLADQIVKTNLLYSTASDPTEKDRLGTKLAGLISKYIGVMAHVAKRHPGEEDLLHAAHCSHGMEVVC